MRFSARHAAAAATVLGFIATWVLLLGAAVGGSWLAAPAGAAADAGGCPTTLRISGPTGLVLTVTPGAAATVVGQCVSVTNGTRLSVSVRAVRAGAAFFGPVVLGAGATTSALTPGQSGRVTVHATVSAAQVVVYSGVARLTVSAGASASASPTPTRSAAPGPPRSARPTRHPSAPSSTARSGAATASATGSSTSSRSARPKATGITLPSFPSLPAARGSGLLLGSHPLVAGPPTTASPTGSASPATPPTASAAVVAGVVEPAADDRRGLPIAVAIVLLVGLAGGLGRVALAYPAAVDNPIRGRHRL